MTTTLDATWDFITKPAPSIDDLAARRRARLAAAYLFPLCLTADLILTLIGLGLVTLPVDIRPVAPLFGAVLITVAYVLTRTPYYRVGIWMAVITPFASITAGALTGNLFAFQLFNLPLIMLSVSLLLDTRITTYFSIGGLLVFLMVVLTPFYDAAFVAGPLVFYLIATPIILTTAHTIQQQWKRIEQQNDDLRAALTHLRASQQEAQEISQMKSQFLLTMSHELRTPLNSVIGYADLMLNNIAGEMNDTQHLYLDRIMHSARHQLIMIDEILDFAMLETGRLVLRVEPYSPHMVVARVLESFHGHAQEKNLELDATVDPDVPDEIVGSSLRVEQILSHLVSNAIKFTAEGHVKIHLKRLDDARWQMIVADTGPGIPDEAQDMIFEQFHQVDQTIRGNYGGTGLGLAFVKGLAERMGGTIEVESAVGEGSTFLVTLDIEQQTPEIDRG